MPKEEGSRRSIAVLELILFVGCLIRLPFIGADGFTNDVSSFESWALTLSQHPLRDFYATAGFADYPPGYFCILWFIGQTYRLLVHSDPTYGILKIFVKMPAILMDLVCSALLFNIVRRVASERWALATAALFAFNPAMIFISSYWGQVDSVATALMLGAVYLIVVSHDRADQRAIGALAAAWILLAYSILIKPPAAVLIPLLLVYGFVPRDPKLLRARLTGSAYGIAASCCLAYALSLMFHPGWNPLQQFAWLYERYRYGSTVYPYNSVNAFNIYAVRWPFWQPDSVKVLNIPYTRIAVPQYALGIITTLVAMWFVIERYTQRRDVRSFLEGAFLLCLGFFILSTRMHERYIFNAVVLCIGLAHMNRRYLLAAVTLSGTLFVNLLYSLWYLYILTNHIPGRVATDLVPQVTHPLAMVNVLLFFYLAYRYMDTSEENVTARGDAEPSLSINRWFPPLEGVARMTLQDKIIAAVFTAGSFALTSVTFWLPKDRVFDEIYYARAAEEYIKHVEIYEFTHPPLTKLVITASTLLFGDDSFGWRFLQLIVGALMIGVLYLFAKRLLGSTLFATIAASLLLFDGFHFVQSRIATPEITVACLSLTTLYAFYRLWLAGSVRIAPAVSQALNFRQLIFLLGATLFSFLIATLLARQDRTVWAVLFLYCEIGSYLAIRLLVPRLSRAPAMVSYADGTTITAGILRTPDGGQIDLAHHKSTPGLQTRLKRGGLQISEPGLRVEYEATGAVRYVTPDGEAHFSPEGLMETALPGARTAVQSARGNDGMLWLWVLSFSAGALAASKWNGLFDFFVVWLLAALVVAQPYAFRRKPALWGNPHGFSLDVIVAAMLFVGATIYTLTYIPYFMLHHTLSDMILLQKQMFGYHYDLHATHPYSSKWWEWPLLRSPISYYYTDFRRGAAISNPAACCVAEILALPNPVVWWTGLLSVPMLAWWGWAERRKGYLLLVTAYVLQWLPWILSPRIAFEYHFFPNLAIIVLADAVLLQRIWHWDGWDEYRVAGVALPKILVGVYMAAVVAAFAFWYPILAAKPMHWNAWNARMLTEYEGNNWINPHPGQ